MNKKLGALALVGASAVVLAGCAGGSGGTPERGIGRARSRSGSSVPTRPTPPATTSRRRSRRRTRAGPSRSRRRPGLTRARPTSPRSRRTTRPDVVEVGNTQALGFIDQGLFARHHRHPGGSRRRRPAPRPRGCRHLRRRVLRRAVLRRWPHRLLHARRSSTGALPDDARRVRRAGHRDDDRHRLGHLRAGQGLVQRPSLRVGARRRDRRPGRRRVGRAVLERRERRGPRAAPGGLPQRDQRPGRRRRGQPAGSVLRRRGRVPLGSRLGRSGRSWPRPTPRIPDAPRPTARTSRPSRSRA